MVLTVCRFYTWRYTQPCVRFFRNEQARSLQSTIERMQTSSFVLSIKLDFHWISHWESACPTVPQSDDCVTTSSWQLQRLLCNRLHRGCLQSWLCQLLLCRLQYTIKKVQISSFALSRKLDFPRIPHKQAQPQFTHSPKSSSFRNLSSNEVRYKFREREKVKITFPTKSDAKKITTRRLRIWRRVAVLSRIRCVLPHLSRRLAFMVRIYAPDFGTTSKLH